MAALDTMLTEASDPNRRAAPIPADFSEIA